jgi:large-conductance mechanosensitive channel
MTLIQFVFGGIIVLVMNFFMTCAICGVAVEAIERIIRKREGKE